MLAIFLAVIPLVSCQLMAGGPIFVDVNREDIQNMASFAMSELNTLTGTQNSLVKVVSAKTQVVAGINYILSLQVKTGQGSEMCNVTIWSREWMHDKRMTRHFCWTPHHKRASLLGGAQYIDIHRTDVDEMAHYAVGQYNMLSQTKNIVGRIVRARMQVVAGTNYLIDVIIQQESRSQLCNFTVFYQAWTGKKELTRHICRPTKMIKRQIGMPGGIIGIDVHSEEVQKMANFALSEINGLEGTQNTLDAILSARSQVVSGWMYMLSLRLKNGDQTEICKVKVWSQPWLHKTTMTEHECSHVQRKRAPVVGSPTFVDVNSQPVKDMANFAVGEINGLQNTKNTLVKIDSAHQQLVAGINYLMTLTLSHGGTTQHCKVEVWYQSWTNTKQLLNHHCSTSHPKRSILLGGVQPASLSEPVQKAVSFAEDALNAKTNSMFRMVTQTVEHITRQVVAGIKYNFELHLVTSSCMNGDDSKGKGLDKCPMNTNTVQHQTCDVSVLYQAWAHPRYTLLKDSCGQLS